MMTLLEAGAIGFVLGAGTVAVSMAALLARITLCRPQGTTDYYPQQRARR